MSLKEKKSPKAYRTISEAAAELDVQQHVLRFWESKFSQIKPMKRAGGRRYYRPEDLDLLSVIRDLLYTQGFTIKGVQKILREKGVKRILDGAIDDDPDQAAANLALEKGVETVATRPQEANNIKAVEAEVIQHKQQDVRGVLGRLKEIRKLLNAELPS